MTKYLAIFPAVMALLSLQNSGDFWHQLRTYTWQPVTVIVESHALKAEQMGFWDAGTSGDVRFKMTDDKTDSEFVDYVFQRFGFDSSTAKTRSYIASLAPGSRHVAYLSPDHSKISLGHFPRSYSESFALEGIVGLLMTLLIWRQGRKPPVADQSAPSAG